MKLWGWLGRLLGRRAPTLGLPSNDSCVGEARREMRSGLEMKLGIKSDAFMHSPEFALADHAAHYCPDCGGRLRLVKHWVFRVLAWLAFRRRVWMRPLPVCRFCGEIADCDVKDCCADSHSHEECNPSWKP